MAKYIKTKSNYVLKKEHKRTQDGTIFERDYMTITDKDGFSPSNPTDYGQYKFRFVVNDGLNLQKKHQKGTWLRNESYCIENHPEYWTDGCLPNYLTTETKIVLNPNYESLTDFAYYGSALELVRATITDIIVRFPAELYFTNDTQKPTSWRITSGRYFVENDYGINIYTNMTANALAETDNPYRYFAHGVVEDYVVITPDGVEKSITNWRVTNLDAGSCSKDETVYKVCNVTVSYDGGQLKLEVWNLGPGDVVVVSTSNYNGYRIRPNQNIIDEFFNSLDGFEKVILNKKTVPIYTATFNTPFTTDDGYYYKKEKYTWPNSHDWNPSLSSYAYDVYVQRLVSLATFHDDYDTDNLWRSMTHEAIKNLDWTFIRQTTDDIEEYESIDTSRILPVLKVWGRQYDDIKRYIDNIKYITNVTYNKQNNTPDYFISDTLEIGGWETGTVTSTWDNDTVTDVLYSGHTTGYTATEVNVEVLRRLKLNSPYLLRMKGTVKGVKCLLGLFGIDADVTEYVRRVNGGIGDYTYEDLVEYNGWKTDMQAEVLPDDLLTGLTLKNIVEYDETGGSQSAMVVPWYDGTKQYDGDTYFQMKGGWGKYEREVPNVGAPETSAITITGWSETISNLKFASGMEDMSRMGRLVVKTGDICYVENIMEFSSEPYDGKYTPKPGDENDTVENASHYFVLENDDYSSVLGWNDINGCYGWRSITNQELLNNTTTAATNVHYYESIVDNNAGNNPHSGDGIYDGGEEFFNRLRHPFEQAIEIGQYDTLSDEELGELTAITYDISDATAVSGKTKYYARDDENDSYYVLNDKKLNINFKMPVGCDSDTYKNYVVKNILIYLEQMLPSTAIVNYEFTTRSS